MPAVEEPRPRTVLEAVQQELDVAVEAAAVAETASNVVKKAIWHATVPTKTSDLVVVEAVAVEAQVSASSATKQVTSLVNVLMLTLATTAVAVVVAAIEHASSAARKATWRGSVPTMPMVEQVAVMTGVASVTSATKKVTWLVSAPTTNKELLTKDNVVMTAVLTEEMAAATTTTTTTTTAATGTAPVMLAALVETAAGDRRLARLLTTPTEQPVLLDGATTRAKLNLRLEAGAPTRQQLTPSPRSRTKDGAPKVELRTTTPAAATKTPAGIERTESILCERFKRHAVYFVLFD